MIRLASSTDLPVLEQVYDVARAFMRANGNQDQWSDGHPRSNLCHHSRWSMVK